MDWVYRGVSCLTYSAARGHAFYSTGGDCCVTQLDVSTGQLLDSFHASKHPYSYATLSQGEFANCLQVEVHAAPRSNSHYP